MENYWGLIYAIMKSLGINELEIEDKYLEITPNDIYSMVFTKDIKENKTKIILKVVNILVVISVIVILIHYTT